MENLVSFVLECLRVPVLALALGTLVLINSVLLGQSHPNSSVFKDYRSSPFTSFLEASDATYQLWQGFMLVRQANGGDVLAQHELGLRYLTGKGFTADTIKGAFWIQKAADRNLVTAQYNLGILQYNGWGMQWDPFTAYKNFRTCAEKDMPEGEYVLGQFFGDNLVVARNWDTAYAWVKKAADAGLEAAKEALPEFAKRASRRMPDASSTDTKKGSQRDSTVQRPPGSGQTLDLVFLDFDEDTTSHASDATLLRDALRNSSTAVRTALGLKDTAKSSIEMDSAGLQTIRNAAEAGSPEALTILGRCYEKGIAVEKNLVLAASTYVRAIRLDAPRASELLWNLIQQKEPVDQIAKGATSNDPEAQFAWAGMYALGFNPGMFHPRVQLTDDQALHMLQAAAGRDHLQAIIELGLNYYSGRWVKQDHAAARALWKRAATLGGAEAELRLAVTAVREENDPASDSTSVALLQKGTQDGSVLAQVVLAYCYENGRGVRQNKAEAARLYRAGAQRGSQDAYRSLVRMHDELRPGDAEFRISN